MSDEETTIQINTKGLDALIEALGDTTPPVARVGILGSTSARASKDKTNAEIGMKHEFGDEKVPIRSWLRMPLTEKMQEFLEKSGAFTPEVLAEVLESGSIEAWIEKVGVVGVQVVLEAFSTGGFGKWKPSDMTRKKNHQTLVETQQLRNAVTSEVK